MGNWIQQKIFALRAKQYTATKLKSAYVSKDSKYLRKAYRNGRIYIKRMAVEYLGDIEDQENFDFLLHELRITKEKALRPLIYIMVLEMILYPNIQYSELEDSYLSGQIYLLDEFEIKNFVIHNTKVEHRTIRDSLGYYLRDQRQLFNDLNNYAG